MSLSPEEKAALRARITTPEESRVNQVNTNLDVAVKIDPDRAGAVRQLSQETGTPLDVVDRNFDDVKRVSQRNAITIDPFKHPGTTKYLSKFDNAEVAHDSTADLTKYEEKQRKNDDFTNSLVGAWEATHTAVGKALQMFGGLTDNVMTEASRLLPENVSIMGLNKQSGIVQSGLKEAEKFGEQIESTGGSKGYEQRYTMDQMLDNPTVGNVAGLVMEGGITSLPYMAEAMLSPVTFLATMGEQIADTRAENNDKTTELKDRAIGLGVAVPIAVAEKFFLGKLFGAPTTAAEKTVIAAAAKKKATRAGDADATKAAGAAFRAEQAAIKANAPITSTRAAVGLAATETARKVGTEMGQESIEELWEYMGGTVGTEKGANLQDAWKAALGGAIISVGTSSVIGGTSSGVEAYKRRQIGHMVTTGKSIVDQNYLDTTLTFMQENKIAGRDRESIREFLNLTGGDKTVYIERDVIKAAISEGIKLPDAIMTQFNDTNKPIVSMKISDFAMDVATDEAVLTRLRDHVKLDPQSYSRSEMTSKDVGADIKKMMNKAVKDKTLRDEAQQFEDGLVEQLTATGKMSERDARLSAVLMSSKYATEVMRRRDKGETDLTIGKLAEQFGIQVAGPDTTVPPAPADATIVNQEGAGDIDPQAFYDAQLADKAAQLKMTDEQVAAVKDGPDTDMLTGLYSGDELISSLNRGLSAGSDSLYVESDTYNLGGINKAMGANSKADAVIKDIGDAYAKAFPGVPVFRRGGARFAAIVPKDFDVDAAKAQLDESIKAIADKYGLTDIPGARTAQSGIAMYTGVSPLNKGNTVDATVSKAQNEIKEQSPQESENVDANEAFKTWVATSGGQAGGIARRIAEARSGSGREEQISREEASGITRAVKGTQNSPLGILVDPEKARNDEYAARAEAAKLNDEQRKEFERKTKRDPVTGWFTDKDRAATIKRVQKLIGLGGAAQGMNAVYISADIGNLGGTNRVLGNKIADTVFNEIASVTLESIMAIPNIDVVPFRHGGDEVSFVVLGATAEEVRAALSIGEQDAQRYVNAIGLQDLPHAKAIGNTAKYGSGVYTGVTAFSDQSVISETFDQADEIAENAKYAGKPDVKGETLPLVSPLNQTNSLREQIRINLSAAVSDPAKHMPGLTKLYEDANNNDKAAIATLQYISHDAITFLTSGVDSAVISYNNTVGLFGGTVEPSVALTIDFDPKDRDQILAAIGQFGRNFKQDQIHMVESTETEHAVNPDGSYDTTLVTIDLNRPLTRQELDSVIGYSGLYGMNTTDDRLEFYFVGDINNEKDTKEFEEQTIRAAEAVKSIRNDAGESALKTWRTGSRKLSVFGDGGIEYPTGDLNPKSSEANNAITHRIAELTSGKRVTPVEQKGDYDLPLHRQIAQAYEGLPLNDMGNPLVRRAYEALAVETVRQYQALPIKVWKKAYNGATFRDGRKYGKGEPYPNSNAMRHDVLNNNTLVILGTDAKAFGPEGIVYDDHPLLRDSGLTDEAGKPMLINDLFRAIHDYYAHTLSATHFGPKGEEAAWRNHMAMTRDPWARWALTTETRGQNSWVNARPEVQGKPLQDRGFAIQKVGLLPIKFAMTGDAYVDEEMKVLVESFPDDDAETLFQNNRGDVTNTPEFKRFFDDSKVVDSDGDPLVVYHGTTADVSIFDRSKANIESDLGGGFYFSNTVSDVGVNYAGEGPDLTNKIQRLAERIAGDTDREYNDPDVIAEARAKFKSHEGVTMPVYLAIKNPVVIGGDNETEFTFSEEYNEDTDEYETSGSLIQLMEALREIESNGDFYDFNAEDAIADMLGSNFNGDSISADDLIGALKQSEGIQYATDNDLGDMAGNEIIRQMFERAGYDGFIDHTVNKKFGSERRTGNQMEGMDYDTTHYIAFYPEQIKSAIGNRGTFDESSNILFQEAQRNDIGLYSAIEHAVINLNLPQWKKAKGKPLTTEEKARYDELTSPDDGIEDYDIDELIALREKIDANVPTARGRDIWAKLKGEPGIQKMEYEFLGLEEYLDTDSMLSRQQVIEYIRNNGPVFEVVEDTSNGLPDPDDIDWNESEYDYLDSGRGDYDNDNAKDIVEQFTDDPMDYLDSFAQYDWQPEEWLQGGNGRMLNMNRVLNYYGIGDNGNQLEMFDETERKLLDSMNPNAVAIIINNRHPEWIEDFSDDIAEAFREHLSQQAQDQYYSDPDMTYEYEGYTIRYSGGEYAVYTRRGREAGTAYSLNEAKILAMDAMRDNGDLAGAGGTQFSDYVTDGDYDEYRETRVTLPELQGDFAYRAHFPESNIMYFTRTTQRGDEHRIEELQSDWLSAQRKKRNDALEQVVDAVVNAHLIDERVNNKGYQTDAGTQLRKDLNEYDLKTPKSDLFWELKKKAAAMVPKDLGWDTYDNETIHNDIQEEITQKEQDVIDKLFREAGIHRDQVGDRPSDEVVQKRGDILGDSEELMDLRREKHIHSILASVKPLPKPPYTEDAYLTLALKRELIVAVENGSYTFSWARGEIVQERWSDKYDYTPQYDQKMVSIVKKLTGVQPEQHGDTWVIVLTKELKDRIESEAFTMFQKPWYRSALSDAAESLTQNKGTPEQMLAMLKKAGAKQDEIEATGLNNFMELAGKSVTKDQITRFVRENGVQVDTTSVDPRNTKWTLEGGTNHQELVLSVPGIESWNTGDTTHYGDVAGGTSIAWIRTSDWTDADGNKTLTVEEMQTKRGQEGKAKGFIERYKRNEIIPMREGSEVTDPERFWYFKVPGNTLQILKSKYKTEDDAIDYIANEKIASGQIPTAPFVEKTDAWVSLLVKRVIAHAVENGYTRVAFTTGKQQATRYRLSQVVESININSVKLDGSRKVAIVTTAGNNIDVFLDKEGIITDDSSNSYIGQNITDLVGKDVADKIMKVEPNDSHKMKGLELDIGGEGMKEFYDKIVPNITKDVIRKITGDKKAGLIEVNLNHEGPSKLKYYDFEIVTTEDGKYYIKTKILWNYVDDDGNLTNKRNDASIFNSEAEAEERIKQIQLVDLISTRQPGFDITPAMVEAVQKGLPLFQRPPADEPRGSITMPTATNPNYLIRLLGAGDRSTFLHEASHLFLEMERDFVRKYGVDEDQQALLDWFGIASFEQITREEHEKFAETFEVYLMEGKAPSVRLRNAFRAFKNWLLGVYKLFGKKDPRLSRADLQPEIAEFFDKMLATKEEIEMAAMDPQFEGMFDEKHPGMTDEEWAKYQEQKQKRGDKAEETVFAKVVKELKARKSKEWAEERKGIIDTEIERLEILPVYKLMKDLSVAPMDNKALKEIVGYDKAPGKLIGKVKNDGVDPQEYAEVYGYRSVQEMYDDIIKSDTVKKAAYDNAEAQMIEKYGDILNDGSIEQEALEALHNEEQAELVLMEMRALNKRGADQFKRELLKQNAKDTIAKLKYDQIQPNQFYQAEIRAAKKAATAKTDEEKFKYKVQQIINHYLYKEAVETKERMETHRKYVRGIQTREYSARQVDPVYVANMKAIANMYDMRTNPQRVQTVKSVLEWYKGQLGPDTLVDVTLLDHNLIMALEADADGRLPTLTIPTFDDLTAEELQAVADQLKHLRHLGGLLSDDSREEVKLKAEKLADSIITHGGKDRTSTPGVKRRGDEIRESFNDLVNRMPSLRNLMRKLDDAFKDRPDGKGFEYIYRPIEDAVNRKLAVSRKIYDDFKDDFKEVHKLAISRKIDKTYTLSSGGTMQLNSEGRVMMALYWGTESSREAIMQGFGMNERDVMTILADLTVPQLETVNKLWKMNESIWPELSAASIARHGVAPPKLDATPFEVNGVKMTGGHMRLFYDAVDIDKRIEQTDAEMMQSIMPTKAGSLHARVGSGGRPVLLDINNIAKAMNENIHYIAFAEMSSEVSTILHNKNVKAAIERKHGRGFWNALTDNVKNITANRNEREAVRGLAKIAKLARNAATMKHLAWSIRNTIQQFSGVKIVTDEVGAVPFVNALSRIFLTGDEGATREFIHSRSQFMSNRTSLVNREAAEHLNKINVSGKAEYMWKTFGELGFAPQTVVDSLFAYPVWLATYERQLGKHGDDKLAASEADTAVSESVGSGSDLHAGALYQGNNTEFIKLMTAFGSWFNAYYNRIYRETGGFTPADLDYKAVRAVVMTPLITAVVSSMLIMDMPDEDEDWFAWAAKSYAGFMFAMIPLVRDVAGAFKGYTPKTAVSGLLESPAALYNEIRAYNKGNQSLGKTAVDVTKYTVTSVVPIPGSGQVLRILDFMESNGRGEETGSPVKKTYQAMVKGPER